MTPAQPLLFGVAEERRFHDGQVRTTHRLIAPPEPPAARSTDPPSSHEAIEELSRSDQREGAAAAVLAILEGHRGQALTYREVHELLGRELDVTMEPAAVQKRLNDLRKKGHVTNGADRPCRVSSYKGAVQTWRFEP